MGGFYVSDQPGVSQNSAVRALVKDHAQSSGSAWTNDHVFDIHSPPGHFIEHETAKGVIAANPDKPDVEAEPRCYDPKAFYAPKTASSREAT